MQPENQINDVESEPLLTDVKGIYLSDNQLYNY